MKVRPYRDEDWPAVCQVYDLAKPEELSGVVMPEAIPPLDSDSRMRKLFAESAITVAELSARLVGFAGSRGSFITWLFVHPEFRRAGVASALLRDLLTSLDRPVVLNVASSNIPARTLYGRFGFQVEREFLGDFQGTPCAVARLRLP
jgi:ribosomal protein S18 acetylase RimI-like enzyme